MDIEQLERHLSDLEDYMLNLESKINRPNSSDSVLKDHACFIHFISKLCACCGINYENQTRTSGKKAASTFKKAANSKVVKFKEAEGTLCKQYQDNKGLLRITDKKILNTQTMLFMQEY